MRRSNQFESPASEPHSCDEAIAIANRLWVIARADMQRVLEAADLAAAAITTAMTMLRRGHVYRYNPLHEVMDGYSDDKGNGKGEDKGNGKSEGKGKSKSKNKNKGQRQGQRRGL